MNKLVALTCLLIIIYSCNEHHELTPKQAYGPDSAPSSWMYNQRAFPNGINREIKAQAAKQFKAMQDNDERSYDNPWKSVGPYNIGGRFTDVALDRTNENIIYAGSSVGGVWKSIDKGVNWDLIFDEPGGISIGNVEVSKVNPDLIYVGTGEANGSATSGAFFGNGIYKSEDAGSTWKNMGLPLSDHIGRIVSHPTDEDIVYVAVAGKLYGKNQERGLYKTLDGGVTWEQKLFINDSTAVIDVAINDANPNIVYAASWERTRFPEGRIYGGMGSAIHRSSDGGETWEKLTNGLPANDGTHGRIGLAISPLEPNVVYASFTDNVVTNIFLGIYRSNDFGDTWTELNDEELGGVFSSFGWFFGNVRVHPENSNEVYLMGLNTYNTKDGQNWTNWTSGKGIHVDQHGMEIHPDNPNFQVITNDGGIYITEDGGLSFRHVENIDNNQFYECAIHPTLPETYLAGAQDNGTLLSQANGADGYVRIAGGDGFGIQFDKVDPDYMYVTSQFGNIRMSSSLDPFASQSIRPPAELARRTNWNTPFLTIPNLEGGIIYGAQSVLKSEDFGTTWDSISPDLTNGPYVGSGFGTITCLAISDINKDIIIAGTDDGNAQITTDGGNTWTLVSDDLPLLEVSSVATDPFDEARIYITFSGYRKNNYLPHVLRSDDYGDTWTDISANLPESPINEIVIDPSIQDQYYLATDLGVFVTSNSGGYWQIIGSDLPNTIVADLDINDEQRLLLAGTFGRSMYRYDLPTEPLSSNEIKRENIIKVYPNPTSDILNIQIQNTNDISEISIVNQTGQVIRNIPKRRKTINISDLPVGSYILRLVTDSKIVIRRFIKI